MLNSFGPRRPIFLPQDYYYYFFYPWPWCVRLGSTDRDHENHRNAYARVHFQTAISGCETLNISLSSFMKDKTFCSYRKMPINLFQAKNYIQKMPKLRKRDLQILMPDTNPQGTSTPQKLSSSPPYFIYLILDVACIYLFHQNIVLISPLL